VNCVSWLTKGVNDIFASFFYTFSVCRLRITLTYLSENSQPGAVVKIFAVTSSLSLNARRFWPWVCSLSISTLFRASLAWWFLVIKCDVANSCTRWLSTFSDSQAWFGALSPPPTPERSKAHLAVGSLAVESQLFGSYLVPQPTTDHPALSTSRLWRT